MNLKHLFMFKSNILVIIFLILIFEINCKRGGGGGGRGSSRGGSRTSFGSYRSYRSYRAGSVLPGIGAGVVAYGVMSSLASRGYQSNFNRLSYSSQSSVDSVCVNNEDFNGTVFGTFECPLPGFDVSDYYCCGSLENKTQFCCNYNVYHNNQQDLTFFAIICIIGIVLIIIYFGVAIRKFFLKRRQVNLNQQQINLVNINRNLNYYAPRQTTMMRPVPTTNINLRQETIPFNTTNQPNFDYKSNNQPNIETQNGLSNINYTPVYQQNPPSYSETVNIQSK